MSRPLYPPKCPWYPVNRSLVGPQNRCGRCAGYRTSHRPACNLVTIPTMLSRSLSSQQYEYKQVKPNPWLIKGHVRKDGRESADDRVVLNTAVATTGVNTGWNYRDLQRGRVRYIWSIPYINMNCRYLQVSCAEIMWGPTQFFFFLAQASRVTATPTVYIRNILKKRDKS